MPSIHEIAKNIEDADVQERIKHLRRLNKLTGRNVICYYSDFFSKQKNNTGICDSDLHGIMSTVYKLDKTKGLDLVLHTPGGDPAATESIVNYLRSIFDKNIRAIVPHMAMSAGTMLACSCKEIIMAKHSSLGPIDPQYSGIPVINVKEEFEKAKGEMVDKPETAIYWRELLGKYPAAIYEMCKNSIELSEVLVRSWLETNMLDNYPDAVDKVIEKLNENQESKVHSRHFDKEQCKAAGLKIIDLESDQKLQDIVLSIHHCYMYLFNRTNVSKITENQLGISVVEN